jgi:putative cell wall-binding protein
MLTTCKKTRFILLVLLTAALSVALPLSPVAYATEATPSGQANTPIGTLDATPASDFTYTKGVGVVYISGYTGSAPGVTVPATIEGLPVSRIGIINSGITSLDVSACTSLTFLSCGYNQLTTLDVSKNTALVYLECGNNKLTSLDVSKRTALLTLVCDSNQLTTLDVTKNTALVYLGCGINNLTTLDVTKNTALNRLSCGGNQLTTLDVSKNTALTYLSCGYNQLATLDVSKNTALTTLDCYKNLLTTLDVSRNTALVALSCSSNKLTALDVSKNTLLTRLDCSSNLLTTLDVSKHARLGALVCRYNYIADQPLLDALVARFGSGDVLPQYQLKLHLPHEGPDRYATAAAVFTAAYPAGAQGAIVATGENFPDALAASSLAGLLEYPIVLVTKDSIPEDSRRILASLIGKKEIIVAGSAAAVSEGVYGQLNAYGTPLRLGGADRYETALAIYEHGKRYGWPKTAIVTTGAKYPDALAISPYAAFAHAPVFLVGDSVPAALEAELQAGGFNEILVLGREAAVSRAVESRLTSILGFAPTRLGGADRYATSARIAQWAVGFGGMGFDNTGVATGLNFPDSLAGGPLLAKLGGVLLLASDVNTAALDLLAANKGSIDTIHTFGGTSAVSTPLRHAIADKLGWDRSLMK